MIKKQLKLPHMTYKGENPLIVIEINKTYILGVYQGKLSTFDLLLRYRTIDKKSKSGWTRIRTPKHIHWAVDVLMKMQHNEDETKKFLDFLLMQWEKHIKPIKSKKGRDKLLNVEELKKDADKESKKYPRLANKGEYSIKFLYLIAKLLMVQEKTNLSTAYMFKKLLETLKTNDSIYKVLSIATLNR